MMLGADPHESQHKALTAYLFGAEMVKDRHLVVEERSTPLCDVPPIVIGSKPIDGGYYIFAEEECAAFLAAEPAARPYMRPYIGGDEFINGDARYILALQDASPIALRGMPSVLQRVNSVARYRRGELAARRAIERGNHEPQRRGAGTVELAARPTEYHVTVIPDRQFLAIPEVSSERRNYIPIGWIEPPTIPSNLLRVLLSDDRWYFGVLTSRMHMAWLTHIGGRLESRYRYGIGIVYNTFPWPEASNAQRERVRELAQAVLTARAAHPGATLADLYDPDVMPPNLRQAHRALDAAVDRLYKRSGFADDRERAEHLFGLYEQLVARLPIAELKCAHGRRRSKSNADRRPSR